jgi:hypothetical protein
MSITAPEAAVTPVILSIPKAAAWIFGTLLLAVLAYYFIGVDEGATSVFGNSAMVHELVHDARHFLGFPCH